MYSGIELQHMKNMTNSEGWKLVQAECERRMAAIKDTLTNPNMGIEEVRYFQGEYKAIKEFLNKFNIKS